MKNSCRKSDRKRYGGTKESEALMKVEGGKREGDKQIKDHSSKKRETGIQKKK